MLIELLALTLIDLLYSLNTRVNIVKALLYLNINRSCDLRRLLFWKFRHRVTQYELLLHLLFRKIFSLLNFLDKCLESIYIEHMANKSEKIAYLVTKNLLA